MLPGVKLDTRLTSKGDNTTIKLGDRPHGLKVIGGGDNTQTKM